MTMLSNTQKPLLVTSRAGESALSPLDDVRAGTVSWLEIIRLAFDSLFANKSRSVLTMLGVIIGVASVVALLSLGSGASAAITSQVESIGTNLLTVIPGAADRGPGSSAAAQTLTLADANAIKALNLPVIGVAPQYGSAAQIVAAAADKNASVAGVTADYAVVNSLVVAQGAFIDEAQVRSAEPVIVLGSTLAQDLFGSGQAVGQTVRVKGQTLRVIGVLASKGGSSFGSIDDRSFVPITVAQQRLFGGRTPDGNNFLVSSITISAQDSRDLDAIQTRVTALLRERHNVKADGSNDDFSVFNQASFLSTLNTITSLLTVFLAAVAGISLLVGGIGIMNIMLVSVTERTREIGLRKAVGAREQDILLQFIIEALVISVTGGIIGLLFGGLIALGVTLSGALNAPVTASAVAIAVGFSMAVGLFFGIWPARRAAKLNPIDALRYE